LIRPQKLSSEQRFLAEKAKLAEDQANGFCGCVFVIWWSCVMGIVFNIWEKIGDYFAWDKDDRWLYFLWFIGVIIVVVVLWILRWRIKRLLGIK
jgi:hypothetical protein